MKTEYENVRFEKTPQSKHRWNPIFTDQVEGEEEFGDVRRIDGEWMFCSEERYATVAELREIVDFLDQLNKEVE